VEEYRVEAKKKKKSTLKKGTYNTASEENIRGLEEV
jgi:hypothetical protein